MGVIQEAIAEARNPLVPTADLLRTCQVIAYRLRNEPLKSWVHSELNGYPSNAQVPEYREIDGLRLKGTFAYAVRWVRNADVPVSSIPVGYQEAAMRTQLHAPLAELEGLVHSAQGGSLRTTPIPPEVYPHLEIFELMTTMELWCELSAQSLAGVVDQGPHPRVDPASRARRRESRCRRLDAPDDKRSIGAGNATRPDRDLRPKRDDCGRGWGDCPAGRGNARRSGLAPFMGAECRYPRGRDPRASGGH
jgi:hypothetical protein